MTDAVPMEIERLRKAATVAPEEQVVPLALAERTVTEVLEETESLRVDLMDARNDLERLQAEEEEREALDPLEDFSEGIQAAHERAHHSGHWETCPNLVCRGLEEWMLRARKDAAPT